MTKAFDGGVLLTRLAGRGPQRTRTAVDGVWPLRGAVEVARADSLFAGY